MAACPKYIGGVNIPKVLQALLLLLAPSLSPAALPPDAIVVAPETMAISGEGWEVGRFVRGLRLGRHGEPPGERNWWSRAVSAPAIF